MFSNRFFILNILVCFLIVGCGSSGSNSGGGNSIHPTSVEFIDNSDALVVGSTKQLSVTMIPLSSNSSFLHWESTDSSIAEISSSGVVLAKASGRCRIQVSCVDTPSVISELLLSVIASDQIIGTLNLTINSDYPSSAGDSSKLGMLIAKSLRVKMSADAGVVESGSLYFNLPAGDLTLSKAYTLLPYGENVRIISFNGPQLKGLLERNVEKFQSNSIEYLQFSNLTYSVDMLQSFGSRVSAIKIGNTSFDPFDAATYIKIAITDKTLTDWTSIMPVTQVTTPVVSTDTTAFVDFIQNITPVDDTEIN